MLICSCGYEFPAALGRYGCPNCEGEGMAVTFTVEVEDCSACPCMKAERRYTADSFEMVFDWKCTKNHGAIVATLDWNDPKPPIPGWCPLHPDA